MGIKRLALMAMLATAAPMTFASDSCASASAQTASLSSQHHDVLQQLGNRLDQASSPLLNGYVSQTQTSSRSSDYVLRNYARVAVAATLVSNNQYEQARQALAQVELDSPAAVRAALLLAESYRLQGDNPRAAQWMLRIADRYASDPDALDGLLLAAEDAAERGDIGTALAVYSRVLEHSLNNLNAVKALASKEQDLYEVIVSGRIDNTRSVTSEAIQRVLRDVDSDSLHHYRLLNVTAAELACLERQRDALKADSFEASLGNAQDAAFATMLKNERSLAEADREAARAALDNASPYDDLIDLEARLAEAEDALGTIETRLAEINARNQAALGAHRGSLADLEARLEALTARRAESQAVINASLARVLGALQRDYREMAGEAQMGRAQMQQMFALVQR